ncbi:protein phosphatase [Roseimicrobium gellanilyticum]|uniref:Protein phosphatase n=1 Tax=Roseimicrobium gellanilyticum TaxID=748857 RepID=A0A366HFG1_9BACT|nr:protein phosphatase 2C domain-containing protein [Roseimicrobium gellanilyticum]RBP41238.1 protein phosphatase [Roseimicrobium gellanilyticum]
MIAELTFAGRQVRGVRENQEDSYGFCVLGSGPEGALLLALADGMGGHERGEVASALAVECFLQRLDVRRQDMRQAMLDALHLANSDIAAENARRGGAPDEMGTTFVGIFLHGKRLRWVSVGDSPLYLYRAGVMLRLNEEHTVSPVDEGSTDSAVLTSALTGGRIFRIDAPEDVVQLMEGDIIVCCSDGMNTIPLSQIGSKLEIYSGLAAGELAEKLMQAVESERKDGQDNLTVTVMKCVPATSTP